MIPRLILNEPFDLVESYVYKQLQEYTLSGGCCLRVGGIRYKKVEDKTSIIAWQCNLADVQNYDVRLPTIITIELDCNDVIIDIKLSEKFKGSQGIPCSQKYLQRRLTNELIGESFSMDNVKIKDQFYLACRHVYELVYGAASFKNYCENEGIMDAWTTECTKAYQVEDSLEVFDRISINGNEAITKIKIDNFKDSIKYEKRGTISEVSGLEITGFSIEDGEFKPIKDVQVVNAKSNTEFVMYFMKAISRYWMSAGKRLGVKGGFYFSQIWAPTFYGIITQGFALAIFNKNYAYFQHCISGIQHVDDKPCCIGIVEDIDECMKYFKDFCIEDLY